MIEFYTADQNMLFAVLFSIVIIFFVIELLGLLFVGLDIAGLVDSIFPDIDLSIDADVDAGAVSKILGWLKYKEIPLILALFIPCIPLTCLNSILGNLFLVIAL